MNRLSLTIISVLSLPVEAADLELANSPATGSPGQFAAEEIRHEAVSHCYSIRVTNEGGRSVISVCGADVAGAFYSGIEIEPGLKVQGDVEARFRNFDKNGDNKLTREGFVGPPAK